MLCSDAQEFPLPPKDILNLPRQECFQALKTHCDNYNNTRTEGSHLTECVAPQYSGTILWRANQDISSGTELRRSRCAAEHLYMLMTEVQLFLNEVSDTTPYLDNATIAYNVAHFLTAVLNGDVELGKFDKLYLVNTWGSWPEWVEKGFEHYLESEE